MLRRYQVRSAPCACKGPRLLLRRGAQRDHREDATKKIEKGAPSAPTGPFEQFKKRYIMVRSLYDWVCVSSRGTLEGALSGAEVGLMKPWHTSQASGAQRFPAPGSTLRNRSSGTQVSLVSILRSLAPKSMGSPVAIEPQHCNALQWTAGS